MEPQELMAYLDGELPLHRAAETAAHFQECRECQILAAELKSLSEGLTAWDIEAKEFPMSADLVQALEERGQTPPKTASARRWKWFGAGRLPWFAPWIGGGLAGGVVVLLLTLTMIGSFSRAEHETWLTASRETAMMQHTETSPQSSAARAALPAPPPASGARNRLSDLASSQMTDAQRLELARGLKMAQLSSNLDKMTAAPQAAGVPSAPMILRTAQLTVVAPGLDKARAGLERIVRQCSGYVGDLTFSAPSDGPRKLTATLRVPAAQLDAALAELKRSAPGRVRVAEWTGRHGAVC